MSKTWFWVLLTVTYGALWAQPVVPAGGAVNAADYSKRVAPGGYITIFGSDLAPAYELAQRLPLPTSLGGTSIELMNGGVVTAIPLWFVSPGQVSGQLLFGIDTSAQVRVRTAAGFSRWDALNVVARAPAYYTVDQQGAGRAVATHQDGLLVSRENPLKPGEWISLYVNSLGAVEPPKPAGQGGGDGTVSDPFNRVMDPVTITIDGRNSETGYVGLAPYLPGLYQVNIFTPYLELIGDLETTMTAGNAASTEPMSLPVEPNGFYFLMGASKFPNGQTKTAVPGPGSAVVFRHETPEVWGQEGFEAWSPSSHLGPEFHLTSGLALTLRNDSVVIYDNNGIEDGSCGDYYDNSSGSVDDNDKPGLFIWFSMSDNLKGIFATHFRLREPTTFTEIIGYFDGNGRPELRFDPNNVYNRYRMNIFSDNGGGLPAVNSFTGDIFSSDTTLGRFDFSPTEVRRVFSDGAFDVLFRLVYTLNEPITLPPGDYWFSHDTAAPLGMAAEARTNRRATSSAIKPLPEGKVTLNR